MKEDLFENKIKEALNSFEPEVPEALWTNIRAQIPVGKAPVGGSASGISALKWAAPAAAVIGGALALWYFTGSHEEMQPSQVQNYVQHRKVAVPEAVESSSVHTDLEDKSVEQEINQSEFSSHSASQPAQDESLIEGTTVDLTVQTPDIQIEDTEQTTQNKEELANEVSDSHVLQNDGNDQKLVAGRSDLNEDAHEDEDDHGSFELVEVGILADKVTGETPLTVHFRNVTNARSFEWDFGNGKKSYEAEPSMIFTEEGDFSVRLVITNFDGMVLQDAMEINAYAPSTLFYPQAFTPNGDGINDFFELEGTNLHNVRYTIQRPDGSVVFEGHGMHARWDGSDSMMPEGRNYMVVIHYVRNNGEPAQEVSKLLVIRDQ